MLLIALAGFKLIRKSLVNGISSYALVNATLNIKNVDLAGDLLDNISGIILSAALTYFN